MSAPTPVIAIPARMASTRLPGKPLRLLGGRTLIEHVIDCARRFPGARVVVATDHAPIADVSRRAGVEAVLTRADHSTGSDRLAELASLLKLPDDQVVVNLQGDEPQLPLNCLLAVVEALAADRLAALATLSWPIETIEELFDPNCVKLVTDEAGRALYFSRAPIPWARDALSRDRTKLPAEVPVRRHIGLYAYRAGALKQLAALPPTALERAESLEQLRALGHGLRIAVAPAPERIPVGVDTEADLQRVESELLLAAARGAARSGEPARPRFRARAISFVCMGNICRSPLSLAYAQKVARERGLLSVLKLSSRGTHADHRSAPADLRTQMLARAQGLDLSTHRAAPITVADFFSHDLLIAHDQRNVSDLLRICPPGQQHKVRRLLDFTGEAPADVPDPYYGDHSDFILVDELVRRGITALFGQLDV